MLMRGGQWGSVLSYFLEDSASLIFFSFGQCEHHVLIRKKLSTNPQKRKQLINFHLES